MGDGLVRRAGRPRRDRGVRTRGGSSSWTPASRGSRSPGCGGGCPAAREGSRRGRRPPCSRRARPGGARPRGWPGDGCARRAGAVVQSPVRPKPCTATATSTWARKAGERGGLVRHDLDRRHVPAQRRWLPHGVERGARLRGGSRGDEVGALLEVAAVEGHEAEASIAARGPPRRPSWASSSAKRPTPSWSRRARSPKVAVSTAASPRASSRPSHFGPKSVTQSADRRRPVGDEVDHGRAVADVACPHPQLVPAVVRQVERRPR